MQSKKIPQKLQPILWSCDINQLDIERDKGYIIHQILIYGTIDDLRWLFHTYSKKEVIYTFTHTAYKSYYPQRFYFVKNYLLGLKKYVFNERLYIQNTPRDLGYQKGQPIYQVVSV